MKIAIVSDDEKTLASHFGRARGFVIFEVDSKEIKNQVYRLNTFTGHARGLENANHQIDRHTPIINALRDCQTVISHGMGMRIYNDLKNAGIEVFITDLTDIQQALNAYLQGTLVDRPDLGCNHQHD